MVGVGVVANGLPRVSLIYHSNDPGSIVPLAVIGPNPCPSQRLNGPFQMGVFGKDPLEPTVALPPAVHPLSSITKNG